MTTFQGSGILGVSGIEDNIYYRSYADTETATNQSFSASADTIYCTPFVVDKAITVNRIGVRVKTGTALAQGRVAIYTLGNDRIPETLVVDGGAVDVTSAGSQEATIADTVLNPGLYGLAVVVNDTVDLAANRTVNPMMHASLCLPNPSGSTYTTHFTGSHTFAAFPATFPTVTLATGNRTMMWLRKV